MPSSFTYLIDSAYLKQFTFLSKNINDAIVNQSIERMQLQIIQPILGKPLYDKIITSINNNGGSYGGLDPIYIELLEGYVYITLQEYSLANLLPFMNYSFNQKGIATRTDGYQQAVDLEEVKYLKQEVIQSAKFYAKRLNAFLCENKELIPEYTESSYDLEANPQTIKSYNQIYLPSKRRKKTVVPTYTQDNIDDFNIII